MRRNLGMFLAAVLALAGCDSAVDRQGPFAARTAPLPDSQSPELGCDIPASLPPGGITAVDTSLTPRSDLSAEILAMEASGELVAPQALYERVKDELQMIVATPGGVPLIGCGVQSQLLIGVTDAGYAQIQGGEYTAWDDYNSVLRMTDLVLRSSAPGYSGYKLVFDGVYNLAALEAAYGQLPEMRYADRNGYVGASSDACLERFGDALDTHVYVFRYGSGDCPAGCTSNTYYGYSAEASGAIEYLGSYSGSGTPPDWFDKAQQCRNFLR
jgi:hypothetical protein